MGELLARLLARPRLAWNLAALALLNLLIGGLVVYVASLEASLQRPLRPALPSSAEMPKTVDPVPPEAGVLETREVARLVVPEPSVTPWRGQPNADSTLVLIAPLTPSSPPALLPSEPLSSESPSKQSGSGGITGSSPPAPPTPLPPSQVASRPTPQPSLSVQPSASPPPPIPSATPQSTHDAPHGQHQEQAGQDLKVKDKGVHDASLGVPASPQPGTYSPAKTVSWARQAIKCWAP